KYPEESALLLNYFIQNEEAVKLYKTEHGPLGSKAMNEVVAPLLDPADQKVIAFVTEVSQHVRPLALQPTGGAEVIKLLTSNNEAIAFNKKTVEQAVNDFFAE